MPDASGHRTIDGAPAPGESSPPIVSDKSTPEEPLQVLRCDESLTVFRRLFSHGGDAALLTWPNGWLLAANAAACAVFRMSEADLLASSREGGQLTLADETDPRLAAAIEARARDGSARAEIRLRRGDGELFDAEVVSVLFLNEGAERTSLMTVRDVSACRRYADALEALGERTRPHERMLTSALAAMQGFARCIALWRPA